MATYQVREGFQTNLMGIDFSVLFQGTPIVATKKMYVLGFAEGYVDFRGEGLKYNGNFVATSGVVEGYAIYVGGAQWLSFGGYEVSARSFVKASRTISTDDDQRLLGNMLEGKDTVIGANLADGLAGYAGNDKLAGGGGADYLWGGSGRDKFIFLVATDSTVDETDTIVDFARGDKIVLSDISDFAFIGQGAFTGGSAQVGYTKFGGDTYINADVDGDMVTDMSIKLDGSFALTATDFIL